MYIVGEAVGMTSKSVVMVSQRDLLMVWLGEVAVNSSV